MKVTWALAVAAVCCLLVGSAYAGCDASGDISAGLSGIVGAAASSTYCIYGSFNGVCPTIALGNRIITAQPGFTAEITCTSGGPLFVGSDGGGLHNFTIRGSSSSDYGGAVRVNGSAYLAMSGMTFVGNSATNSGGAVAVSDGASLTASGCTFEANSVSPSSISLGGGAISCDNAQANIYNSHFFNNTARGASVYTAGGGGILASNGADLTVSGCTFDRNEADSGGGLRASATAGLTVSDTDFITNTAGEGGAAVVASPSGGVSFTTCEFNYNVADGVTTGGSVYGGGGGLVLDAVDAISFNGCEFAENNELANRGGGAVAARNGNGTMSLSGCNFHSNQGSDNGGALLATGASRVVSIESCHFHGNSANNDGGGVYAGSGAVVNVADDSSFEDNTADNSGGGISYDSAGTASVDATDFSSNTAASGGGISVYSTEVTVTSGTFNGNSASTVGGALNCFQATCTVSGSEVVGNLASSGGGVYGLFSGTVLAVDGSLFESNDDGAIVAFLADNVNVQSTAFFNNTGPVLDTLQCGVMIDSIVARDNAASEGAIQITGAPLAVGISNSYISETTGLGFFCGDSDVTLTDVIICGSDESNFQCNYGCSVAYYQGGLPVSEDLCAEPEADLPYGSTGGECEAVCASEYGTCVPELDHFVGPFYGCFECGGECWNDTMLNGTMLCPASATICLDTEDGSAECSCRIGFEGEPEYNCTDIDECLNSTATVVCPEGAQCNNTIGSYTCSCSQGFIPVDNVCVDENECNTTSPCGGDGATCINTIGGYICTCGVGFYKSEGGGCDECPAGSSTSGTGSLNITSCVCDPSLFRLSAITTNITDYSEECVLCPPGFFSPVDDQCIPCPANTWSNGTAVPACNPCGSNEEAAAGSTKLSDCACIAEFTRQGGVCKRECPPGTYRPTDDSVCVQCEAGTYSTEKNKKSCTSCPAYNVGPAGATNLTDCVCETNFVRVTPNATTGPCMRHCPKGTFRPQLGSLCIDCAPGTYADMENMDECLQCPPHSSSPANATSANQCTCDDGYAVEEESDGKCYRQCRPGSFRPDPTGECQICGNNFYTNEWNLEECTACPANNVAPPNTTDIKVCECEKGYYTPERKTGTDCLICPEGGSCKGGTRPPTAKKGFAPVFDEDGLASFTECVPRDACAGNGECSIGYDGDICQNCVQNYYRLSGYCKECDDNPEAIVAVCVFALWLFCAILVWFNTQERVVNRFASLVIGLNSLQIAAQYGRLDVDWPYLAQRFFDILSIANFNLELVAPECAVPVQNPFALRWVATMMLPLVLAGMFASVYGLAALILTIVDRAEISAFPESLRMTPKYVSHTCLRAMYQIMMIIYLPLSASVFELFDCVKDANGKRVINSSRSTACYDPAYWRLFPIGLLFMILYPIGMPIFYYALLDRKRKNLGEVKFSIRYGFLVGRFQPEFYLFELLIMMRKLGVVLCMAFLTSSPYIKAGGAIIVLQFSLWLHLEKLPYRTVLYNWMETICLFCAILVLLLSMLFQDPSFSKGAKNGTIITVLMVNVLVIVVAVVLDSLRLAKDAVGDGKFEEGYYDGATTEPSRDTPMVDFTGAKATTMSSKSSEHGGAGVNGTGSSVTYDAEGHETIETRNSVFELDKDDGGAGGIVVGSAPAGNGKADPPMPDPPAASSLPHPPVARPPVPGGGPRASGVSGGGGGGGGLPLPPPPASMDTLELPAPPPRRPSKPAPPRPSRPIPAQPPASSQFDSFAEQQQI